MEKSIREYISESLSDDNKKRLIDWIDSRIEDGKINDGNISGIFDAISKVPTISSEDRESVTSYLTYHGLENLNYGRVASGTDYFIDMFNSKGKLDKLVSISKTGGVFKISDIPTSGNIYEIIDSGSDNIHGWSDVAKILAAEKSPSKSVNIGPYEILLRFAFVDGNTPKSGDVGIGSETMEVKAATRSDGGKRTKSGAHFAGQDIAKPASSIYYILNRYAFCFSEDESRTRSENKDLAILQRLEDRIEKDTGNLVKGFYSLLKEGVSMIMDRNPDIKIDYAVHIFKNILCDAIYFQYGIMSDKEIADHSEALFNFGRIGKDSASEFRNEFLSTLGDPLGQNGVQNTLDAVGTLQIMLYQKIHRFNYLLVAYIDYGGIDSDNGDYFLINDFTAGNFKNIFNNLSFKGLDSPISTQGRTGKVSLKKK